MRGVRRALLMVLPVAGALASAIGAFPTTSAVAAAAAQGGDAAVSIRLLEGPSERSSDPRASQYVIDHLQPGDRISRRFQVTNRTGGPIDLQLYDAAGDVHDGAFHFADGRGENELTSWTSVAPASVSLPAGASETGTVTIDVPSDASGGERYAVVWAELPGALSPSGITVVNRVGIRIYLSVGGDEEPPTKFRVDRFTPVRDDDGRPGIDITACNEGGRAVDLEGSLTLTNGPGGSSAGPFQSGTATTLAPGECGVVSIRAPGDLPAGPWRARASLRSGVVEESAQADVTFPATPSVGAPVDADPVTRSGRGLLLVLLALLLLLAVLALLWWVWRRHRGGRGDGEGAGAGAVAAG